MAVCRVEKTKNYTVMSNYHLNDPRLSLKAIGLLSKILSLPEAWDYTVAGLARICREGRDAVRSALAELEEAGLSYSVVGDESDPAAITVTEQVPAGGSAVPKEGTVVLYTSGYDESSTYVTVPDFTGYTVADANYVAGLNMVQISVSGSSAETATVTAQSIEAGEQVKQGTVITLTFVDTANTETGAG